MSNSIHASTTLTLVGDKFVVVLMIPGGKTENYASLAVFDRQSEEYKSGTVSPTVTQLLTADQLGSLVIRKVLGNA